MASSQFNPFASIEKSSLSMSAPSSTPAVLFSLSNSFSTSSPSVKKAIRHQPESENEIMSFYIPDGLPLIILDYLDGDLNTLCSSEASLSSAKPKLSLDILKQLTFLGRNIYDLMAPRAAKLILSGEEKDADEVVEMIRNNPALLEYQVQVIDLLGRSVKQKVFEIAIMAGDVNLQEGIVDKKEKGLVERLAAAGHLFPERIAKGKEVILSEESVQANALRNQRILEAVIRFAESIINLPPLAEEKNVLRPYLECLEAYGARCQPVIDQFEEDLQSSRNEVITLGYIFDLKLLLITAMWFKANVNRFGGWESLQRNILEINGYGKLQANLSSRDAQVTKSGIGQFFNSGVVPPRSLKNPDGTSYFYNLHSRLGKDFNIDYYGRAWRCRASVVRAKVLVTALETLCRAKTAALQNLRNVQSNNRVLPRF